MHHRLAFELSTESGSRCGLAPDWRSVLLHLCQVTQDLLGNFAIFLRLDHGVQSPSRCFYGRLVPKSYSFRVDFRHRLEYFNGATRCTTVMQDQLLWSTDRSQLPSIQNWDRHVESKLLQNLAVWQGALVFHGQTCKCNQHIQNEVDLHEQVSNK